MLTAGGGETCCALGGVFSVETPSSSPFNVRSGLSTTEVTGASVSATINSDELKYDCEGFLTKIRNKIKHCGHPSKCCSYTGFGERILDVGIDRSPGSPTNFIDGLRKME